jgi:co-chaperonin GroES (HSP10)
MAIVSASKIEQISQAKDKRKGILDAIGDLNGHRPTTDLVLVGTYIRDEKRQSGLYLPTEHLKEDEYQGKVGLVLSRGPYAYGDWEEDTDKGQSAKLHTWVVFAVKDAWPLQINGVACRVVPYDKIRMIVDDPATVF